MSDYFNNGVTMIDQGGTHENNPHEGVQMGVAPDGKPNLVEEGEAIYNDYVFSNRLRVPKEVRNKYKLRGPKNMTFAEAFREVQKESAERPNDPISRAGFEAQMQKLTEQQERQKQEMEAQRAKAAFEALSPEEQTAVMQQVAQQAQAQQQAIEENSGNIGGISPNELQQQQMM
jgi:hypothetical protein